MTFKDYAKQQFEEWSTAGKCSDAVRLNNLISDSEKYFDETNPGFFYGDLKAPLVLVHLNPKRGENDAPVYNTKFKSFDEFWTYYTFFGKNKYGNIDPSNPPYKKFDLKQIRFLKAFRILPFTNNNQYQDLEIVIDKKLQIDLIPFGSPSFDSTLITDHLQPYFDRLFEVILSVERKYIIFCGAAFKKIKIPNITKQKEHNFNLVKKDGSYTKNEFELVNVEIDYKGQGIQFSIATHFAVQGIPMDKYGEKVAELYGVF